MEEKVLNNNQNVISVRKKVEFETFLEIIKGGNIENWSVIAEALGVREATISEWKKQPLARKAIADGIQRCLEKMEEVGQGDWRMWREKLKILFTLVHPCSPLFTPRVNNLDTFGDKLLILPKTE